MYMKFIETKSHSHEIDFSRTTKCHIFCTLSELPHFVKGFTEIHGVTDWVRDAALH